jgi:hypothetical protein
VNDKEESTTLFSKMRIPAYVIASGAVGGILSWIYSITVGDPFHEDSIVAIASAVPLGMGAGFVGVYVLANSDTRALARTLGIAMLCGMFWKPVYDAGREQVLTGLKKADLSEATETLNDQIARLDKASEDALPLEIAAVQRSAKELLDTSGSIRDRRLQTRVEAAVNESVIALNRISERAPEDSARALGEIGATGAVRGRPEIAEIAAESIATLSERSERTPDTAAAASNSLLKIARSEALGDRPAQSAELQRQALEIYRSAKEAYVDLPEESRRLDEASVIPEQLRQVEQ